VRADEAIFEFNVLVVPIDASSIRHLVWVLGDETAVRAADRLDVIGVVEDVDVPDEFAAGQAEVVAVVDDVDLAHRPVVAHGRVDGLRHDAAAVRSHVITLLSLECGKACTVVVVV